LIYPLPPINDSYPYISWALTLPSFLLTDFGDPIGDLEGPVIANDGSVYFTVSCYLLKVSKDHELDWSLPIGPSNARLSAPCLGDKDEIFVISSDGQLVSISSEGDRRFNASIGRVGQPLNPPLYHNGTIYCAVERRALLVDVNGSILWTFDLDSDVLYGPSVSSYGSMVICEEHRVTSIGKDGKMVFELEFTEEVTGAPSIGPNGTIYLTTMDVKGYSRVHSYHWNGTPISKSAEFRGRLRSNLACGMNGEIYFMANGSKLHRLGPGDEVRSLFDMGWSLSYHILSFSCNHLLIMGQTEVVKLELRSFDAGLLGTSLVRSGRTMAMASSNKLYFCGPSLHCMLLEEYPGPSFIGGPVYELKMTEDTPRQYDILDFFQCISYEDTHSPIPAYQLQIDHTGFNVTYDGGFFTIDPPENFFGSTSGLLQAVHNGKTVNSDRFKIIVGPVDDPPEIIDAVLTVGYEGKPYEHTFHVLDIDSEMSDITMQISGEGQAIDWLGIDDLTLVGSIPILDDYDQDYFPLEIRLSITPWDLSSKGETRDFDLVIMNTNQPPVIETDLISIPEDSRTSIYVQEDKYNERTIAGYDPDSEDITYETTAGPHLVIEEAVSSSSYTFYLKGSPDFFGVSYIDLQISDGEYTTSKRIVVEVKPVIDQVRNLTIEPLVPLEGLTEDDDIMLRASYLDPDREESPDLEIEWTVYDDHQRIKTISGGLECLILNITLPEGHYDIHLYVDKAGGGGGAETKISFNLSKGVGREDGGLKKDLRIGLLIVALHFLAGFVLIGAIIGPYIIYDQRIKKRFLRNLKTIEKSDPSPLIATEPNTIKEGKQ
jgi:outer membrane protein assembly factor BamB